jgi:hypothetical protein
VEIVLGLVVVVVVLGAAFGRSVMQRRKMEAELGIEPEKRMSKREKKLAEIRANDPDPVIPTLQELVTQELSETGVNDIGGSAGLADPVKLKVYHRDFPNLDCPREALHFRLSYGIEAEAATVDDVRLVCDADGAGKTPAGAEAEVETDSDVEEGTPTDADDQSESKA